MNDLQKIREYIQRQRRDAYEDEVVIYKLCISNSTPERMEKLKYYQGRIDAYKELENFLDDEF
jgi:hypothetical protein